MATFKVTHLDHVQIAAPAGCEPEARTFYGELLGMKEIPKPVALQSRGGVWFQAGMHQLHVGVEADFQPSKKAHPAFVVTDFAALLTVLEANHISYQPDDNIPGVRRIYVSDPFGNRLELIATTNDTEHEGSGK